MFVCQSRKVSFCLDGEILLPKRSWLWLFFFSYGMIIKQDIKFAADPGVAHPVHNMTRNRAAIVRREQHSRDKWDSNASR